MIHRSTRAKLFDGEIYNAIVNPKLEGKSHLSKFRIKIFDPIFKPLRIESSHVTGQHQVQKLTNGFPLCLASGMQRHGDVPAELMPEMVLRRLTR